MKNEVKEKKAGSKKEKEFQFDILNHSLVPKHEILSPEKLKELIEDYNITKAQLPKISLKDPVVKSLNAKLGDVLKITRKGNTFGEAIYYREVYNG